MDGVKEKILNLPIFYKIVIANSFVILVSAAVGIWLFHFELAGRTAWEFTVFGLVAITATTGVTFLIAKAALLPLTSLRETVDAVQRGDLKARAPSLFVGDPLVSQFGHALNSMLDELARNQERLEELSTRLLATQEEERKRVARELHDETSQALSSLMIEMKMLGESLPQEQKRKVTDLWAYTSEALDRVRRLAFELRPSYLDELGLVPALRTYVKEYSSKFGIPVDFKVSELKGRLPGNVELALYRVVQEALTNVARHSGASSASLTIRHEDNRIVASVRDNGRGFALDEVMRSRDRGLGLFGMKERISAVSGALDIRAVPGQGTEIVVTIPVREGHGR